MAPRSIAKSIASFVLLALLLSCRREVSHLDPKEKMSYEIKPSVVRVNAFATARLRIPSSSVSAVEAFVFPDDETQRHSATAPLIIETGAGGSGSGVIVHPSGTIVTAREVIEPTADAETLRRQLIRNGSIAALLRLFHTAGLLRMQNDGTLDECLRRIGEGATVDSIRITNDIELSNGDRVAWQVRPSDSATLAVLQIQRKDLPSARAGNPRALKIDEQVSIVGYPPVSSDPFPGGWTQLDSDLEPTINRGAISSIRHDTAGRTILESSAAMYRGNDGGPVFDADGNLVAIAAVIDGAKVLVPFGEARPLLERVSVPLDVRGEFQNSYAQALDAAVRGDWIGAKRELTRANRVFPNSPEVIRLTASADRAIRSYPLWRSRPTLVIAGIAAILAVVIIAGVFVTVRTRRNAPLTAVTARGDAARIPDTLGRFTILNGERAGERLGLGGPGIRIGREASVCDIVLENPRISRLHAEVLFEAGRVVLIDRASSNGTWVNDKKIDRRFLEDGDIIYFGGRNAIAVAYHA